MPDPTPVDIRADGLLWLINRTALNPRGYTLTFDGSIFALIGDGSVPWTMPTAPMTDHDQFLAVEAILARAKREQSGLAGHIEATNPPIVDLPPEEPVQGMEGVPAPGGVMLTVDVPDE